MGLPGKNLINKKLTPLFNVLRGRQGHKAAYATGGAITLETIALGVGITAAVGAFPLGALFCSVGLLVGGIGLAFTAASSIGQRKAQREERKAQKKERKAQKKERKALAGVAELEKEILTDQEALLNAQKIASPSATVVAPR